MIVNAASRNDRRAFTLVELLVAIALMSILATMLSYALSGARQQARIKRTQSEVRMISQILQSKMNEIALSKLEILYSAPANPRNLGVPPNAAAERSRLVVLARRDLMRLVMPECRADLVHPPANLQFRTQLTSGAWVANCAKVAVPSEWNRMRAVIGLRSASQADNYYQQTAPSSASPSQLPGADAGMLMETDADYEAAVENRLDGTALDDFWTRQYESAECLYLILASTDLFGETAIDKIHARSIANLDGDAIPEIIDPWGRPYEFIRDPVGLDTQALNNYDDSKPVPDQYPIDPDPLDFLLADWRYNEGVNPSSTNPPSQRFYPIYLPPVIISAGADGEFDLRRTFYTNDSGSAQGVNDNFTTANITWTEGRLDPLYPVNPSNPGGAALPYRYPDPYFNVSSVGYSAGTSTPYDITDSSKGEVDLAKMGGGLGGFVDTDGYNASSDNITSLDGGF